MNRDVGHCSLLLDLPASIGTVHGDMRTSATAASGRLSSRNESQVTWNRMLCCAN